MARKHATIDEETEINVTPMLDVVFIMLIFFIVTTSFVRETGIDVRRPDAQTATSQDRGNILIAISYAVFCLKKKKKIELVDVRGMVESAVKETPESSAIIVADTASQSGVLIDLMDQVRLGGVARISIAARAK